MMFFFIYEYTVFPDSHSVHRNYDCSHLELKDFLASKIQRWYRNIKRGRAANKIRKFYFDYVLPYIYNPHRGGKGFKRLKTWIEENSQNEIIC